MMSLSTEFPILQQTVHGKRLIYLDNAASSLTPQRVIDAMNRYYTTYRANVHRTLHTLGEKATEAYEEAREHVARFINASSQEIVFTRGTTESINLAAYLVETRVMPGDEIVLTKMEHHSNLLPWQALAKKKKAVLKYINITPEGRLDTTDVERLMTKKTKIVACTLMSNVTGTINDVHIIAQQAHKVGALMLVDAAQAMMHMKVDVQVLSCDFLCFSGHKMMGPTGIGVLYARKDILDKAEPWMRGGEMVKEVWLDHATWNDVPLKFEAGTPPIAEAIGLQEAIAWIEEKGMQNLQKHEQEIVTYAKQKMKDLPHITLHTPSTKKDHASIVAFTMEGVHPHDVAAALDEEGIALRAGHLCAMPFVTTVLGVEGICRASCAYYTTKEDIDALCAALIKIERMFHHDARKS